MLYFPGLKRLQHNRFNSAVLHLSVISLGILLFCQLCQAQSDSVESGLFTLEGASGGQYVVSKNVGKPCPVMYPSSVAGDIIFKGDSIECKSGIQYDTTIDSIFNYSQFFPQISNSDKRYLFDILFKNNTIKAPLSGYTTTVPSNKKLYFIRRNDSTFAAFVRIGEYVGGIDRIHYYLTSTTSKSPRLYKYNPEPYLNSIQFYVFSPDALTGRPDPLFAFTEPSSVSQLLEHIILSMYTSKDSTSGTSSNSSGFTFPSLQRRCDPSMSWAGSVSLSNGYIRYTNEQGVNKVMEDAAQSLERLIISLGIKDDLKSQDTYGTVRFKDLFDASHVRSHLSGKQRSRDNLNMHTAGNMSTLSLCFTDYKYVIPYSLSGSSQHTYLITSLTGRTIAAGTFDQRYEPQTIRINKRSSGMMIMHIRNGTDNAAMHIY